MLNGSENKYTLIPSGNIKYNHLLYNFKICFYRKCIVQVTIVLDNILYFNYILKHI